MDYRKRLIQESSERLDCLLEERALPAGGPRTFESRFWFVDVDGAFVTTQSGHFYTHNARGYDRNLPPLPGRVYRKEYPTPADALAEATKRTAKHLAQDFREHRLVELFEMRPPEVTTVPVKRHAEPYALATDVDANGWEVFCWLDAPCQCRHCANPRGEAHLCSQGGAHASPEVILGASLTPQAFTAVEPVMYTFDVDRLAASAANVRGAAKPVVESIAAAHALPDLPDSAAWWMDAIDGFRSSRALPGGISVHRLPPFAVGDYKLSETQRTTLLRAVLVQGTDSPIYHAVASRLEAATRRRIGLAALRTWITSRGTKPYRGILSMGTALVPDIAAHTLPARSLSWVSDDAFRAVAVSSVLAEQDTQASKEGVVRILDEHPTRMARVAAEKHLAALADRRKEPLDDLLDTVTPTCGLPASGVVEYSYGHRRFVAAVDSDGTFSARRLDPNGHPTGKRKSGLPKPGAKDDPELAEKSRTAFREQRKAVRKVTKAQMRRFENLMVVGRIWQGSAFKDFVAEHPILGPALTGLVWEVKDAEGTRRLARLDNSTLVDENDDPVEFAGTVIRIPHPLDLSGFERQAWTQILTDYELAAPFPQLDRSTFQLSPEQGRGTELIGVPTEQVPTYAVASLWKKHGWITCDRGDGGCEFERRLQFRDLRLQVFMHVGCIDPLDTYGSATTTVDKVLAHPWDGDSDTQNANNSGYSAPANAPIAWTAVPACVTSEVLLQLHQLSQPSNTTT